jgi:broad specificity phosphatase PhoE
MLDELNEFDFGKHDGKTVEEVSDSDLPYLDWLNGQEWFKKHYLHQEVERTCNKRHREIEEALEEREVSQNCWEGPNWEN